MIILKQFGIPFPFSLALLATLICQQIVGYGICILLLFNVHNFDPACKPNFVKFVRQNGPGSSVGEQSINPKLIEVEVENGQISKQILESLLTVQTQLYALQASGKAKDKDIENRYFQLGQRFEIYVNFSLYLTKKLRAMVSNFSTISPVTKSY